MHFVDIVIYGMLLEMLSPLFRALGSNSPFFTFRRRPLLLGFKLRETFPVFRQLDPKLASF
jgi:hypothetical protein